MASFTTQADARTPTATVSYVTLPNGQVIRPMEHDSGNTDVRFVNPSTTLKIVPVKIRPQSLSFEPWTGFGYLENRLFIDDFCHDKELTVKVQANTFNGATLKIKESANINKGPFKLKEDVKLWFPLLARFNSTLHFRFTNLDTRVHYDHGIDNWSGHKVNLYGSFGFTRDWNKYNTKVGLALIEDNVIVDNRITVNSEKVVRWHHRTTATFNEFRMGLVAGVNITERDLVKKDFLLGYNKNEVDVSFKAEQAFGKKTFDYGDWKQWFSKYLLTTVYKRSRKERYGLEVAFDPVKSNALATVLVEYLYSDKGFTKIKVDNLLNLTLMVKKTLTDRLAFSFGTQIPLQNREDKNKFGVQLDFNI